MRMRDSLAAGLGVLALGWVLWLWPVHRATPQGKSCADACYQKKSTEYQRCRTLPPAERARRAACFERADQTLRSCLRACK